MRVMGLLLRTGWKHLALCFASWALQLRLDPSNAFSSWQRPQRWQKRCFTPALMKDGALMWISQMRHFW